MPHRQKTLFLDHSTVVKCFTKSTHKDTNTKGFSIKLSVQLKSSNLWLPPYSNYQQELFDIITKFHEVDGWNFQQISDWLVENNYSTPRGKVFNNSIALSIYKKKSRSIERFSREFDHTITDMGIDVVDYIPKE